MGRMVYPAICKDGFIGTDKNKLQNTVIGALGGAAIGAGGAYAGYEAGNMIMSAGVNAAAGGVVGNMIASGNEVLRIGQCENSPCLWGNLISGTSIDKSSHNYYVDLSDRRTVMRCNINNEKCESEYGLLSVMVDDKLLKDMTETEIQELVFSGNVYHIEEQTCRVARIQHESGCIQHQNSTLPRFVNQGLH